MSTDSIQTGKAASSFPAGEGEGWVSGRILCIDKPLRWTSFDVVNKVRWLLCKRLGTKKLKVGHAGTLDPLATGVMVVCTGRATKRIDELQAATKEYVATLCLGATTPSFDLEHPVDATYPTDHITRELVEQVLHRFLGRIEQVPPAYSAVKVDGHRAYDLARKEKEVELKPKVLVIDEIELLDFRPGDTSASAGDAASLPQEGILHVAPDSSSSAAGDRSSSAAVLEGSSSAAPEGMLPRTGMRRKAFLTSPASVDGSSHSGYPSITIRVVCSKGTYIRALARDIGLALGSGAHLTALRRTRVGDVRVADCLSMDAFPAWLEKQEGVGTVPSPVGSGA